MSREGCQRKRTINTVMLKKIVDDQQGEGLEIVVTIVQRIFDLTPDQVAEQIKFKYRFNEETTKDCEVRRIVPIQIPQDGGETVVYGTRTTFEARIPLEFDSTVSMFPFRISKATATIKLDDTSNTISPDLLLPRKSPRHVINFQEVKPNYIDQKCAPDLDQIIDKVDQSKKYDFLSPYPQVLYEYEKKKNCCQRFVLSFVLVNDGFRTSVATILPLLLTTVIAFFNSFADWSGEGMDASDHLQVSSALTLVVVFLLVDVIQTGTQFKFTQAKSFVIVFFIAMTLASFPKSIIGTSIPEMVGVVLMGVSLLWPLFNCLRYLKIRNRFRREAIRLTDECRFVKDSYYKNPKDDLNGLAEFCTASDLLNESNDLYDVKNNDKYAYIRWETRLRNDPEEVSKYIL